LEALGGLIIGGPWRPYKALESGKHISSQSGRQPVWQGKKIKKTYLKVLKILKQHKQIFKNIKKY
jgi:hypothetical protein